MQRSARATGAVGASALRAWILRGYLRKWTFIAVLIGVVAGLGAILFFVAIELSTHVFLDEIVGFLPPAPRGEAAPLSQPVLRPWLLPVVVGLGGLLSGMIVFTLAPEAEGHGTDAAIEAFHERGGRIRSRIPPIKLLASAITIGSGGSAGREGPTAQIAAGFGSWLGDALGLSVVDRRIAMAAGMGAGIGAIFKAPLGGAILSAEILYLADFEVSAIIPGFIASITGYTIFAAWSGWDPVFGSELGFAFTDPKSLVWYAVLGVVTGLVGLAYVRTFYGTRDLFHRMPGPRHIRPAVAGVLVGLIAMRFPEVLSMGYGWIQFAIEDDRSQLALGTMAALVALKIVATSLTIGSGGSGGVFAPGLFIGGMVGGTMWGALHARVPGMPPVPEPFVVVGMAALFGGIAKAPIAVMLMVAEMTGEFSMIVPAMAATSVAYLITGSTSIYENQVPTRTDSAAHRGEYAISLLESLRVRQAMTLGYTAIDSMDTIDKARGLIAAAPGNLLIVTRSSVLVGMLTEHSLVRRESVADARVTEAMVPLAFAVERDSLFSAVKLMAEVGLATVPVARSARTPVDVVGVVSLSAIARVFSEHSEALHSYPEASAVRYGDPLRRIRVEEAMNSEFLSVEGSMSGFDLAAEMRKARAHAALVVTPDGVLQGIITSADFAGASGDAEVATMMTHDVSTVRPDETLADVLARQEHQFRQFPVVDYIAARPTVLGLLSRTDIMRAATDSRSRNESPTHVSFDIVVESADRANGRTLAELALPYTLIITDVWRGQQRLIPRGTLVLQSGDRLRVMSQEASTEEVMRVFR